MPNSRLVDISRRLSETQQYSSYVVSELAEKRINFTALGTFRELIQELERVADVRIAVNQELKAIHVYSHDAATGAGFYQEQAEGSTGEVNILPGFFKE
jgi:hypothetical protein